eukprot:CAMPEP_0204547230 /NCGR_PEP_ID=MMETSP0661-20131031/22648_1 /ASSEMBLY_ACC=CAM_ASM_000606 /TAXON_ID=109239 /ORGANISM="Alexandrium margalefi, Strain AMGDE01CS-322" /LENGTH=34 /DNA_ID= /DNA_START= /DNA_END= /DNA_ORIENTATION=
MRKHAAPSAQDHAVQPLAPKAALAKTATGGPVEL